MCFAHECLLLDVVCMCDGEDEPGKGRLQMQNDGKMDDTLLHLPSVAAGQGSELFGLNGRSRLE